MLSELRHEDEALFIRIQAVLHDRRHIARREAEAVFQAVDPVAVLNRNDLVLIAEAEPVLYPFVRRIGIVFDMASSPSFPVALSDNPL